MGLLSDKKEIEELKIKTPISPEFVAMISNSMGEEFEEEVFEGNYMFTSKSKIIAITNKDVSPIQDFGLTEITTTDMGTRISEKYGELVGMGQTWVQKEVLGKILETLELYEKEYKLFINANETKPVVIKTAEVKITVAPIVA